jgi:phosphatidylserine/phosphatidylglycerophosphate/cardiolipin synthase-like enzyme
MKSGRKNYFALTRTALSSKVLLLVRAGAGEADPYQFFLSKDSDTSTTYVHAKTSIFDDELAILGSANCNLRAMRHDGECAFAFDPSSDKMLTKAFAARASH